MELLTMTASAYSNSTNPPRFQRGQPSEGHTSAVNVLRMVNSSREHRAAEPVPFRAKPAPLRSIKPTTTQRRATGCAGAGGSCISHPDCPDVHCEGHPDNMGVISDVDHALRPIVWRYCIGSLVAGWAALLWVLWG
jgi:hypothetical protein